MTDEQLAQIKARVNAWRRSPDEESFHMKMDARALLMEVEQLRAELKSLIVAADETYIHVRPYAGIGHTKIVGPFPGALEHARALLAD